MGSAARDYRIIDELVVEGRKAMLEADWVLDSCLPATRAAMKVLAHFGIAADPLAVRVRAMNRVGVDHIDRCRQLGIMAPPPPGAWKVDIGYQLVVGKWAKHVVAIARDRLIDLTLDQVTRRERDLLAQPISESVSEGFLRGLAPLVVRLDRGGKVQYDALPDDTSFEAQPSWGNEAVQDQVVKVIIDRIETAVSRRPTT